MDLDSAEDDLLRTSHPHSEAIQTRSNIKFKPKGKTKTKAKSKRKSRLKTKMKKATSAPKTGLEDERVGLHGGSPPARAEDGENDNTAVHKPKLKPKPKHKRKRTSRADPELESSANAGVGAGAGAGADADADAGVGVGVGTDLAGQKITNGSAPKKQRTKLGLGSKPDAGATNGVRGGGGIGGDVVMVSDQPVVSALSPVQQDAVDRTPPPLETQANGEGGEESKAVGIGFSLEFVENSMEEAQGLVGSFFRTACAEMVTLQHAAETPEMRVEWYCKGLGIGFWKRAVSITKNCNEEVFRKLNPYTQRVLIATALYIMPRDREGEELRRSGLASYFQQLRTELDSTLEVSIRSGITAAFVASIIKGCGFDKLEVVQQSMRKGFNDLDFVVAMNLAKRLYAFPSAMIPVVNTLQ